MIDIYPITIVQDRYTGTYSKGIWTAWNCDFYNIPKEIDGDDSECGIFWNRFKRSWKRFNNNKPLFYGLGSTPELAIENLKNRIIRYSK